MMISRTGRLSICGIVCLVSMLGAVRGVVAEKNETPPATLKGRTFLVGDGSNYRLAWNDEFSGDQVDTKKWTRNLPWTGDDGSNRHHNNQYASVMTDEDVQVRGGSLHLTTRRKEVPNPRGGFYHFTQGMITTSGKFETRYGYLEMRARLPIEAGAGTWPAFWTLSKGWPPEMDILEYWGSNNRTHQGTVTQAPDGKQHWDSYHQEQVSLTGWHTYGMEWGPGYQIYNVDGVRTNIIYGAHIPDNAHYILLNSGVETARPPQPGTIFPNDFEVDWVRVYNLPNGPMLLNGGFEDKDAAPWDRTGQADVVDYGSYRGKRCLRIDAQEEGSKSVSSASQTIYGLKPDTSYIVAGTIRATGSATGQIVVKLGESQTRSAKQSGEKYSPISCTFTTGTADTAAVLTCTAEGAGTVFMDALTIRESKK